MQMVTQPDPEVYERPREVSFRDIERLSQMAGSLAALAVRKAGDCWPAVADVLGREYVREHGDGPVAIGALVLAALIEWARD
jgi:hypothetical protein